MGVLQLLNAIRASILRRTLLAPLLWATVSFTAAAAEPATELVILGVGHSEQLVSRGEQAGAIRAWLDRAHPAAIGIERSPEEFARGSFYEFTYEQQDLVVPYAREHHLELFPIDWLPRPDDSALALEVKDLEQPAMVRPATGFGAFLRFEAEELKNGLFFAEGAESKEEAESWASKQPEKLQRDFPRRLYLYRTFLQAMRIKQMARAYRGKRVVVVVGAMHKWQIERILEGTDGLRIIQPSAIGAPPPEAVAAATRSSDRLAACTFNLLDAQASGPIDWPWIDEQLAALGPDHRSPERELLRLRAEVLRHRVPPAEAARRYEQLAQRAGADPFTWTGVVDSRRLDSAFGPFSNLTIRQRASLEAAREWAKAGRIEESNARREALAAELTPLQAIQLRAYWEEWVRRTP